MLADFVLLFESLGAMIVGIEFEVLWLNLEVSRCSELMVILSEYMVLGQVFN